MGDNDVMEVSGENGDGPWTTRNEKIFIQLMDEEVKSKKSRETGTLTGEAWKRIRSELIRLTGYSYTKEQVKNKYNALRILFNKFNSLKANSGVGWDSTLLTVTAPDDVWERLFKVNKFARKFKKKGMPYYHELCRIFGDTSATGAQAHPSNKVPSSSDSSDPEFQFKDEPEVESAEGSKAKPKAKNKKRDSFAANISSALSQFAENAKRRVDVMERKLHCSHPGCSGVSGSMSIGEVGIGPLAAGMKECQALLNTMDDLDEDSYNKVLEKLHGDVLWRQMFMDMPEKRRIAWIKKFNFCNMDPISDSDDDSDDEEVVVLLSLALYGYYDMYIDHRPCRTSMLRGHDYVLEVLNGHEDRCHQNFRMKPQVFIAFCEALKLHANLKHSRPFGLLIWNCEMLRKYKNKNNLGQLELGFPKESEEEDGII
ncbi:hypothetical protein RHMOL_Rhmol07G0078700 [Rhododendron molle]|uniref:Uncharacterized protein n=1 Tax=Rhododendron molle TaxID=49168 RepID=A0ACC0MZG1_RHOML|nr:hypothetical protein RHMOL_Rhmol07G0078700 [Rhododendron molle]